MVCCHIFVQKSSTCSKHTQNSQCTVHITYGSSDVPLLQYNAELLVLLTSFEIFQETFCGTKAHPQEKKGGGSVILYALSGFFCNTINVSGLKLMYCRWHHY